MQNDFHNEVTDCVATGTVLNLLHQKLLRKLRFPVLLLIRAITSAPRYQVDRILRSMAYHVIHGSDVTSNIIPYAE